MIVEIIFRYYTDNAFRDNLDGIVIATADDEETAAWWVNQQYGHHRGAQSVSNSKLGWLKMGDEWPLLQTTVNMWDEVYSARRAKPAPIIPHITRPESL